MEDKQIEASLLAIKQQAIEATRTGDAEFYRGYLDEQAVAVVPAGVFTKEAILRQMASGRSPFRSSRIDDTRVMVLSPESGLVTYRAVFGDIEKGADAPEPVYVTTVYRKIGGAWKGVFYQQTPIKILHTMV